MLVVAGPFTPPSSLPAVLAPLRRVTAVLLPALLAGALVAGCGDDDSQEVTELLDTAFQTSIGSADVTLDVEVQLDGVDELQDPVEVNLTGPYESGGDKQIPSLDWDITASAQGQSFNANLTSTGDRAFIGFQGTDYEVSQETVAALNQTLAAGAEEGDGRSLSDFGVNARDWVVDASDDGDEDVAGVETTHVSGELDVSRVLEDLNTIVQKAAKLGGAVGQTAPPELTDEQKGQIEDVVEDPTFDAYVGKDDDRIHRLSADVDFEVPEDTRDQAGGLEGGTVSFSIEFANVGSPQPVTAPEDARPISELTQQLQGLLGGALGAPQTGGGGTTAPAPPQTDAEKQKAYEECIKTDPSDESVKSFCEVLLQ
jgi:hypothetical protein